MSSTESNRQPSMSDVTVYSTQYCPYCVAAKRLLNSKGIEFKEVDVSAPDQRRYMEELSGRRTVPQIFADGKHIGGFTDLAAYFGE